MGQILAAIAGLGTIIGGIVYIIKYLDSKLAKSPQDIREDISKEVQKEEDNFSKTGRP